MELVRTFVAVELSAEVKAALAQAVAGLRRATPPVVRWASAEGMHLTLQVLGPLPAERVSSVTEAVGRAAAPLAPFRLQLGGLGAFPAVGSPRVVWVGVGGEVESLRALQAAVEAALWPLGFPPERRPFSPHLTLGRMRDGATNEERRRLGQALGQAFLPELPSWAVREVGVIRSTLTPQGALYTPLGSGRLEG
ncbi:MAG: RNA 2',3'-cyclic phosphodiesterase [Chloroflexi bacterium]|nr:RNA 2',3'-cyclic phosphodiesterase [Chloroflexota bacterium]